MNTKKIVSVLAVASLVLSSCNMGGTSTDSATSSTEAGNGQSTKAATPAFPMMASILDYIGEEYKISNLGRGYPVTAVINNDQLNTAYQTGLHFLTVRGGSSQVGSLVIKNEIKWIKTIDFKEKKADKLRDELKKANLTYASYATNAKQGSVLFATIVNKNNITPEYMYGFQGLEPQTIPADSNIPTFTLPDINELIVYVYPLDLENDFNFSYRKTTADGNINVAAIPLAEGKKSKLRYRIFLASTGEAIMTDIEAKKDMVFAEINSQFQVYEFAQVQFPFFATEYHNEQWAQKFTEKYGSSFVNVNDILTRAGIKDNDSLIYTHLKYKDVSVDDQPIQGYVPASLRAYHLCAQTVNGIRITELCHRHSVNATEPANNGYPFFYQKIISGDLPNFDMVQQEPTGQWPAGEYQSDSKVKIRSSYEGILTVEKNEVVSKLDTSLCAHDSDIIMGSDNKLTCKLFNSPPVFDPTPVSINWNGLLGTYHYDIKITSIETWKAKNNGVSVNLTMTDTDSGEVYATTLKEPNVRGGTCPSNKVLTLNAIQKKFMKSDTVKDIFNNMYVGCANQGENILPAGSYRDKCGAEFLNLKENFLSAECKNSEKEQVSSTLDITACNDFQPGKTSKVKVKVNDNGQLACAAPYGNYVNNCTDISYDDTTKKLDATCKVGSKEVKNSGFKVGNCTGAIDTVDVDKNAKLICIDGKQEDDSFVPLGTYRDSCDPEGGGSNWKDAWDSKTQVLRVQNCRNPSGLQHISLNYGAKCIYPQTVSYKNGKLVCDKFPREDL